MTVNPNAKGQPFFSQLASLLAYAGARTLFQWLLDHLLGKMMEPEASIPKPQFVMQAPAPLDFPGPDSGIW